MYDNKYIIDCLGRKVKMHKKQMKKQRLYVIVCEISGKYSENWGEAPGRLAISGRSRYNSPHTIAGKKLE